MNVTIFKEKGFWTVHLEESEVYPLIPETGSLYLLVKAIHSVMPNARVLVDPRISRNPFLSHKLFISKYYHLDPDYARIQYSLMHPEVKVCGICGTEAWYNSYGNYYPHIGWWECTNPRCQAHEHDDGRGWYKLSRYARKY